MRLPSDRSRGRSGRAVGQAARYMSPSSNGTRIPWNTWERRFESGRRRHAGVVWERSAPAHLLIADGKALSAGRRRDIGDRACAADRSKGAEGAPPRDRQKRDHAAAPAWTDRLCAFLEADHFTCCVGFHRAERRRPVHMGDSRRDGPGRRGTAAPVIRIFSGTRETEK